MSGSGAGSSKPRRQRRSRSAKRSPSAKDRNTAGKVLAAGVVEDVRDVIKIVAEDVAEAIAPILQPLEQLLGAIKVIGRAAPTLQPFAIGSEHGAFHVQGIPTAVWASGAPILWQQGITGKGVKVAVLDTGIDDSHPDLKGKVIKRRDYINDGEPPGNWDEHGTHCAGTIAAGRVDAGAGVVKGAAPGALLMDYRVLGKNGGSNDIVARAVTDAVNDGADIISMSLGTTDPVPAMERALKYAVSKNVLVVAAAGNAGPDTISYPAFYKEACSVGAVDYVSNTGKVAKVWFSTTNKSVDVASDGFEVLSTWTRSRYNVISGTSMATPCVSGMAALLLEKTLVRTKMRPTDHQLFQLVKNSTVDILGQGIDSGSGAGYVTAYPSLPTRNVGGDWILPGMEHGSGVHDAGMLAPAAVQPVMLSGANGSKCSTM